MARRINCKWFLIPVLGCALLAGGVVMQVQAGKPGGGGGGPVPVLYNIRFWDLPSAFSGYTNASIRGMNNAGQVVGHCFTAAGEQRGFLYDPMYDSNGNPTATVAVDLNTIVTNIPDGMVIGSASDINDSGVIVGYLVDAGKNYTNTSTRVGFILDRRTLALEFGDPPMFYCVRINNNGDILVAREDIGNNNFPLYVYRWGTDRSTIDWGVVTSYPMGCRMNNSMQVSGPLYDQDHIPAHYRWDAWNNSFDPIPAPALANAQESVALDINDWGWVCGSALYWERNKQRSCPFQYDFSTYYLISTSNGSARSINSTGDVFYVLSDKSGRDSCYVYHNTKPYAINSLINPNDSADATRWSQSSAGAGEMNDADETGFGQLIGGITFADGRSGFYLLTPTKP